MSDNDSKPTTVTDPCPPWKSMEVRVETVLTVYAPPYSKLTSGLVADSMRTLNLKGASGEFDILESQVHTAALALVEDAIGNAMSQAILGDVLGDVEDSVVSLEQIEWSEEQVRHQLDLCQIEVDEEAPLRITVQDNKTYHA